MKLSSPLIGLGGRLRSGKDAVADRLVAEHGYVKLGMSDSLLDHLKILDPLVKVTIRESSSLRLRILPGHHRASRIVLRVGYVAAKTVKDLREFMQRDGTDAGRWFHGENVWVNRAARSIDDMRAAGHPVVITGIRFPNEAQMIRELGGQAVWVDRPALQSSGAMAAHASENSVGPDDFDQTIVNDGTLDDLYAKAAKLASAQE